MGATLFGDIPDKPKRKKRDIPSIVTRCFERFEDQFVRRHGIKPIFSGGKDGRLFQLLSGRIGDDATLELIDEFFATSDAFVLGSDYSVGAFYAAAQRLRLGRSRVTDARTAGNMDAMLRAAQPLHRKP